MEMRITLGVSRVRQDAFAEHSRSFNSSPPLCARLRHCRRGQSRFHRFQANRYDGTRSESIRPRPLTYQPAANLANP
jgi:hypothetical protein